MRKLDIQIIKAEMAKQQVKQADLAYHWELSPQAVSRRLRGTVPFTANEVASLAETLGLPIAALYSDSAA